VNWPISTSRAFVKTKQNVVHKEKRWEALCNMNKNNVKNKIYNCLLKVSAKIFFKSKNNHTMFYISQCSSITLQATAICWIVYNSRETETGLRVKSHLAYGLILAAYNITTKTWFIIFNFKMYVSVQTHSTSQTVVLFTLLCTCSQHIMLKS